MSYDVKKNTITVNDVTYRVSREPDRGHPEETLTLLDFDVEQDEFVDAFPGLSATLGMEEYIEDYMSPRDWSNVGTMAVSYSGYNLGDEDIKDIDFEVECPLCGGEGYADSFELQLRRSYGSEVIATGTEADMKAQAIERNRKPVDGSVYMVTQAYCEKCEGNCVVECSPIDYFKRERGARVVIGLTVYEHGGISMSAGNVTHPWDTDRWDTSFVGFIFDTPEGVKQCLGDNATDEEIEAALRSEVEVYSSYLEGDVSRWSVQDDETDYNESCGGYIGDAKGCEDECFSNLEYAITRRLSENKERAHWNARGTETK